MDKEGRNNEEKDVFRIWKYIVPFLGGMSFKQHCFSSHSFCCFFIQFLSDDREQDFGRGYGKPGNGQ